MKLHDGWPKPATLAMALLMQLGVWGQAGAVGAPHATTSLSQAPDLSVRKAFDIPSQPLAAALLRFSEQASIQVMTASADLNGRTSAGVVGEKSIQDALSDLLRNTGLRFHVVSESAVSIEPIDKTARTDPVAASTSAEVAELATVVVTGSRIRGGATPSPVVTIDAKRIREEGFSDLGEVIRSLPQNFSGGQNPGVVNGTESSRANQNINGGSSLNLRGLGPDATLTLLNGRRLSYGGDTQMVDISAIPVEAVERIEIVADGASALYGSDAVGGVGNVILKRDFDGVALGARYGVATEGGLDTREFTVTAGTTWPTGGLIATWKKTSGDPIYSDQRGYTRNMYGSATLYSGNDLRSALLSAHQSVGEVVEIHLDVLRTKRDMTYYYGYAGFSLLGASGTAAWLVSPSVQFSLPKDWTLNVGGTQGRDENDYYSLYVPSDGALPYGFRNFNRNRSYEIGAEGPLLALRGGDARLAVGAGYRYNDYLGRVIGGTVNASGDDSSRFAYAELGLPLVSPGLNIIGIHRLELSAALRGEDYRSFGRVTTPKLGLIYGPSADFTFKASWGKSFKAPTLLERYRNQNAYLYPASALGGTGYPGGATVLMPYGGNRDLEPERARTWSTTLAFHPARWTGLETELTWFDIDYTDRVVQPITNSAQALNIPDYAPFIDYSPTAAALADILENFRLSNFSGAPYDPATVVAILTNQYMNAARQRIRGLDLSGGYRFDIGPSRLVVRGSASWLDSVQQTTAVQSPHDLSGTLFNPPKVVGRLGAVWSQAGLSASVFANYKGGVTNTLDKVKSASFTAYDATLRYDTGERRDAFSGMALELSAQNLFNRAPPLYAATSFDVAPYDSTNYPAIGRYLSFSVTKHF